MTLLRVWCQIAFLLLGTAGTHFRGMSELADFSKSADAELLLYSAGPTLLVKGEVKTFEFGETSLFSPGACCVHDAVPSLSSDGKRIAYVRLVSAKPRREVVSIYDIGERTRSDVFNAAAIWGVAWSPDGNRLAVVASLKVASVTEAADDLYVITVSPHSVRQLSHGAFETDQRLSLFVSGQSRPSWNPASSKIAFQAGTGSIVIWDMTQNKFLKVADGKAPSWSPVDDLIAYIDPSGLKCMGVRVGSSEKTLLFSSQRRFMSGQAPLFFPVVWAPKGDSLIFHQEGDENLIMDIYEFNFANRKSRFITRSGLRVVDWRNGE